MSKKDYQAIARALHSAAPGFLTPGERRAANPKYPKGEKPEVMMWQRIVYTLADDVLSANPRFDRARFIEACETGTTKGMPKRVAQTLGKATLETL